MPPEQLVELLDFTYVEDVLPKAEALALLKQVNRNACCLLRTRKLPRFRQCPARRPALLTTTTTATPRHADQNPLVLVRQRAGRRSGRKR